MSTAETYRETLEILARGEEIKVVEALKERASALLVSFEAAMIALGEDPNSRELQVIQKHIATQDLSAEELLAVAFPVVEYGSARAVRALSKLLSLLTERVLGRSDRINEQPLPDVVIGELWFALATYAIARDNVEAIIALGGAPITRRHGAAKAGSFGTDSDLRYQPAFGGNASMTLQHYREWLAERAFLREVQLFEPAAEPGPFFECDFFFALYAAVRERALFSNGISTDTAWRAAARFRSPDSERLLAFFGLSPEGFEERLEAAYQEVRRLSRTNNLDLRMLPTKMFGNDLS